MKRPGSTPLATGLFIGGILLIVAGTALVSIPVALMVAGVGLAILGLFAVEVT